jgi:hypothetical protein
MPCGQASPEVGTPPDRLASFMIRCATAVSKPGGGSRPGRQQQAVGDPGQVGPLMPAGRAAKHVLQRQGPLCAAPVSSSPRQQMYFFGSGVLFIACLKPVARPGPGPA